MAAQLKIGYPEVQFSTIVSTASNIDSDFPVANLYGGSKANYCKTSSVTTSTILTVDLGLGVSKSIDFSYFGR